MGITKTPRKRADACFAVARSTTHDGEREAAIGRGKAICERHGLDLDDFDIPGRKRTLPSGGMRNGSFDIDLDLHRASADNLADAFAAMAEAVQRANYSRPFHEFGGPTRPARPSRPSVPPGFCPLCGTEAEESRFSAPCFECVPSPSVRR